MDREREKMKRRGPKNAASELCALLAISRDVLLASADNVREISWCSLCRPLFLRVCCVTVLVELRLNGFLILFAVRSVA